MQEKLYNMLLKEDEITWQSIILGLIKTEQMDPWDINISELTQKYIQRVRKLQETNFFISGKIILASALLLKIKSNKLVSEDLVNFDSLLYQQEEQSHEEIEQIDYSNIEIPPLAIKTPQARKRKVSVNDLINALQKALNVSKRKVLKRMEERNYKHPEIPIKKVDITQLIKEIYDRILEFFKVKEQILFSELVRSDKKEDKIYTLIPLLHLDNQNKINLIQKEHFGNIEITQ